MLGQKHVKSKKICFKKWKKKIQEKKVGQKLCHLKNYSLHLIRVKSDWPDFSYQNFG